MKKQFFRVKQLADQTFLRAEKSKQLSNELQEADQKVEYLRIALAAVAKRLPQTSSSLQEKDAYDKRLRKLIEYQLGTVMREYGIKKEDCIDHDESLLRPVLVKCGKAQIDLAKEMTDHEIKVEQMVSNPIQSVLENDIPAILKTKRNLSKLVLDKDSANSRYQTASKHGAKNEALKDEMEEAEQKVEHCRDSLAAEMFSLLRRESDFAQYMLQLVKLQRAYHESALHTLEQLIPELEKEIGDSPVKAVYGCPLEEHLRLSKRQIALPLELCVCALWELGMTEEGLFRVAGGTSRVRRMKLSLDSGCFQPPLQLEYRDVHVIASALKSYLRELPEPLLTYQLYEEWIRAARTQEELRFDAINNVLSRLPQNNYDNLRYLIKFLGELSKNPRNKMSSSNIAIVIAPNLLWSMYEMNNGIDMSSATIVNSIVEILVSNVDFFFPGDLNIYQTFKRDDLFSDLTEFERPVIAHHLRSSSNDTALIQVDSEIPNNLSDRSSPPQGSPKPISRKKNKPAPVPPISIKTEEKPPKPSSYPSGSSTINRTTYRQSKMADKMADKISDKMTDNDFLNGKTNKMSVSVGTDDFTANRRKSLDFDHSNLKNNYHNIKKPEGHINKSDISSPIATETTANIDTLKNTETINLQPTNFHQITAQNATVGKIKITSENLQQKSNISLINNTVKPAVLPIAAPRISLLEKSDKTEKHEKLERHEKHEKHEKLEKHEKPEKHEKTGNQEKTINPEKIQQNIEKNMSKSLNEIDLGDGEIVTLRKSSRDDFLNRPNKPVVPERPATLRPSSFRSSRQVTSSGSESDGATGTLLERTHVYSVPDKQQVAIVYKPGHDTQLTEKEKFLMSNFQTPRLSLENNNNSSDSQDLLVRTTSVGSRPGRPPKPEVMKSLERIDQVFNDNYENYHVRTLSDGDLIDCLNSPNSPNSPKSPTNPPASPRGFNRPPRPQPPPPPPPIRPKSDGESTNL